MDYDRNNSALRALARVRQIFDEVLNPHNSLIAIDLLLAAACHQIGHKQSCGFTVKQLFAQMRHSDRAVRIHFNRLVDEGLLITEPGLGDRRTKHVRLSPKGEQLLRRIAATLVQTVSRGMQRTGKPGRKSLEPRGNGRISRLA